MEKVPQWPQAARGNSPAAAETDQTCEEIYTADLVAFRSLLAACFLMWMTAVVGLIAGLVNR